MTASVPRPMPLGSWTARAAFGLCLAVASGALAQQRATARPERDAARKARPAAKAADATAADAKAEASKPASEGRERDAAAHERTHLLPTTWQRWRSLEPGQRKKYIENYRRFVQAPERYRTAAVEITVLKKKDPEALDRLSKLLPKVKNFVASLTPSERSRLRAMTPEERARWIAQRIARERLKQKSPASAR